MMKLSHAHSKRVFQCTPLGCAIFHTKSERKLTSVVIAFFAGGLVALQAFISGALTQAMSDSLWAGLISNLGALIVVSFFLLSFKFRFELKKLFQNISSGQISIWLLLGGCFGAIYVATSAYSVAAIGTGLFTIGIVASTNLTSLTVDRIGFGSARKYSMSFKRVAAAILAVIAVALAGFAPTEKIPFIALLMVAVAGVSQVLQLAFNSNLTSKSTSQVATFVNFPIAVFFGFLFVFVLHLFDRPWPKFPQEVWLYFAGPLGAIFVLMASWLVKEIGLLVFTLATISGQLLTAIGLDYFLIDINLGWQLISGAILVLVAVYLASDLR